MCDVCTNACFTNVVICQDPRRPNTWFVSAFEQTNHKYNDGLPSNTRTKSNKEEENKIRNPLNCLKKAPMTGGARISPTWPLAKPFCHQGRPPGGRPGRRFHAREPPNVQSDLRNGYTSQRGVWRGDPRVAIPLIVIPLIAERKE